MIDTKKPDEMIESGMHLEKLSLSYLTEHQLSFLELLAICLSITRSNQMMN